MAEEPHLDRAAQGHSDDMSARDYFSHDTPEGDDFADRITEAGYPRPGAENIAKGASSAEQVMQMWMNSSGHRDNILNCSLKKIGVGVATSGWYWTQDFGY
ncbi:CAP domain-containing protein [Amycolatopsis jejuensis]|uniref:CAP domain-containing protein n=1 Tax=Amycolatopsis jejuensis TaxID=330084 RepID=UPI00316AC386